MNRTYRYRLYPTKRQAQALESQLAFCCDLWNAALEQRKDRYRAGAPIWLRDQQHQYTEIDRGEMNSPCVQSGRGLAVV